VGRIQQEAAAQLALRAANTKVADSDMEAEVRRVITEQEGVGDPVAVDELIQAVMAAILGVGWLQELLEDTTIENVRIIGSEPLFVRTVGGVIERRPPVVKTDGELIELVRNLAEKRGRKFGRAHPVVHMCLPDGSRLSACAFVADRPHVALRRHRLLYHTLADLEALGTFDADLGHFLDCSVRAKLNILVSGGMDCGKTTLLRALAASIPPAESIYLVELVYELGLQRMRDRHPMCVAHEERDDNIEGAGQYSMAKLVEASLKFSVDRVIVGEATGAEIVEMLKAMSTGRSGSMGTIHADSSEAAFDRILQYGVDVWPIEKLIRTVASTINLIVHVETIGLAPHEQRVITSVRAVNPGTDFQLQVLDSLELWTPGPDRRAVRNVAPTPRMMEKLRAAGWRNPWAT
jgi:Flp pilus assembly CpaF family ATPase